MIDLDAYLARTGYTGAREPTLATLHALCEAHVQTIPFENIDVLRGVPIALEPAALEEKLVHARRGGYCFEQNALLLEVLTQLGFTVRPLSGRVRYQRPRDFTPARTHLFLRVELEGEAWIVDAGVGAMSVTSAMRLVMDEEQVTPHEPRRFIHEAGLYYDQVKFGDEWHDVKEFTLEEMPPIDRVVGSWYTSTHPASHFKSRLLVARAAPGGQRITLLNRELAVRERDGSSVKTRVETPAHLLEILATRFGIALPLDTVLRCEGLDW